MTILKDLLASEPRIVQVPPTATVRDAVKAMADADCGSTIVMEDGRPIGIFTERDLVKRVIPQRGDLDRTPVKEVMSSDLVVASPGDLVGSAILLMHKHRIRHLPIVDEGGILRGVLSIRDLIRESVREMRDYIAREEG